MLVINVLRLVQLVINCRLGKVETSFLFLLSLVIVTGLSILHVFAIRFNIVEITLDRILGKTKSSSASITLSILLAIISLLYLFKSILNALYIFLCLLLCSYFLCPTFKSQNVRYSKACKSTKYKYLTFYCLVSCLCVIVSYTH